MSRRYWFGYNGLDGDENVLGNYSLLTTNPGLCGHGPHLCAIYVYQEPNSSPSVPSTAFFTTNIQAYITNGKNSQIAQPLSFPKFVYVKQ